MGRSTPARYHNAVLIWLPDMNSSDPLKKGGITTRTLPRVLYTQFDATKHAIERAYGNSNGAIL